VNQLLIIEDLPEVSAWLSALCRQVFTHAEIRTAAHLRDARQQLADLTPDLALIDLGLPDGDGTLLIREMKALKQPPLCVVTTIFDDSGHLFPALRAGADGYLLKSDPEPDFVQALQGILGGRPPISASMARAMLGHFHPRRDSASLLTRREEDILVLIANGYSVRRAAEALKITENTAAGYLKNIYQKLQVSNRAEAALQAVHLGLIHPADRH
tara:strand:- start:211 stop:852 length:642 start_codon:yes stop_codon:yes gene_type:complete